MQEPPKVPPLVMSNFQHRRTSHPASRQVQPELERKKKTAPSLEEAPQYNLAPYRSSNGGQLQQFPLLIIRRQQPAAQKLLGLRPDLGQSNLVWCVADSSNSLLQAFQPALSLSRASLSFSHSHTHSRNARLAFATKPPPLPFNPHIGASVSSLFLATDN